MIARNIRDLDSILLEGISPGIWIKGNLGLYFLHSYIRNREEGLSPKEVAIIFSSNGQGLNFDASLGGDRLTRGSIKLDENAAAELLSRRRIEIDYVPLPDTAERIKINAINGFPILDRINFDRSNIEYVGKGVFLDQQLLELTRELIAKNLGEEEPVVDTGRFQQTQYELDETLGYYVINANDPINVRVSKFFANLERRGFYQDGKLDFKGQKYNLDSAISISEAARAIGFTDALVYQLNKKLREFAGIELPQGRAHVMLPLYHGFSPSGTTYANRDETLTAFFTDQTNLNIILEQGIYARRREEADGISKKSVLEGLAKFHKEIWDWLAENNYKVPSLETANLRKTEKRLEKQDRNLILQGRTFEALCKYDGRGHSVPLLLVGSNIPSTKRAYVRKGEQGIGFYSKNGLIGSYSDSGLVVTDFDELTVTYRCDLETSTITVLEMKGIKKRVRKEFPRGRLEDGAEETKVEDRVLPLETVSPELVVARDSVERRNEITAGNVSRPVPVSTAGASSQPTAPVDRVKPAGERKPVEVKEPTGEKITGRDRIAIRCGFAISEFPSKRGILSNKGLMHQDSSGAWYVLSTDITRIKQELGIKDIHIPTAVTVPTPAPVVSAPPVKPIYNIDQYVILKYVTSDICAFYLGEGRPFGPVMGAIESRFGRINEDPSGDNRLNFIAKKDVGEIVRIFKNDNRFSIDDRVADSIVSYYNLEALSEDDVVLYDYIRTDRIVTSQGIEQWSRDFYLLRYAIVEKLGREIKLGKGQYPVTSRINNSKVEEAMSEYLASTGKAKGNAPPRTQVNADDQTLPMLMSVEALVAGGVINERTRRREFQVRLARDYTLEGNYAGQLWGYVNKLIGIKSRANGQTLNLDAAVVKLKEALGYDESTALSVLSDTIKVTGEIVPEAEVLTYVERALYLRDNPRIIMR